MARPTKLQPLVDAVQVLEENIELLPKPLSNEEQWVLNRLLEARTALSHAWVNSNDEIVKKFTENALYSVQGAIFEMGQK